MKKNSAVSPPLFYFKVNLKCCITCQNKAKKRLQKLDGVVAVNIDKKAGLVAISGQIEPQVVVKKIAEWGKKAVIWSPPEDTSNTDQKPNRNSNLQNAVSEKGKESCRKGNDSTSVSDSESGDDEDCGHEKPSNSKISWQHPDIANKSATVATTKQRKKRCWLWGLCREKDQVKSSGPTPGGTNPSFKSKIMGPTSTGGTLFSPRWPPMGMYDYGGGSRPFFPSYGNQLCRPMAYGSVAMPPPPYDSYPYHQPMHLPPPPLPPPPGGYYSPRTLPQFNPMIHFTRYEDNYSYW